VTRSHQEPVEVRVPAETADVETRARAAIARNTGVTPSMSRSGGPIADAGSAKAGMCPTVTT